MAGRGGFGPRGFDLITDEIFEDYEAVVPFYALAGLGVAVHCAPPGKTPGDPCPTAVHDFLGYELYTELPGHRFRVTAAAADPSLYDALVVSGDRFVEQLSVDPEAVVVVRAFAGELRRTVVLTCQSQVLLAAAGAMGSVRCTAFFSLRPLVELAGVRCTAFFSLRPLVELAGGTWVEPDPFSLCVADRHRAAPACHLSNASYN
ncbi:intracellular protease, PfpI family protein [Hordeum vulgare]|nr:intracellular protease, PfpI family protein [Hordeum vulgare]